MLNQLCRFGLAIGLLLAAAPAQSEVRFGIASEPYRPFYSMDADGQWVGWEIDMMNAVCRAMNEKCSIVETSWDAIIPGLNAGLFDVIWASMTITDERSKLIDFTDPYYNDPYVVIGQRNGDLDTSPNHLAGKRIGVLDNTIQRKMVEQAYPDAVLEDYGGGEEEVRHALSVAQVDYTVDAMISAQPFLASKTGIACCEVKGPLPGDIASHIGGVGGGVRKTDAVLKAKLNAAIKAVLASSEYEAISKKYFQINISPQ